MKKIFPLLLLCLLWLGCDPAYDVFYSINNQSDNKLTIVTDYSMGFNFDTTIIAKHTKVMLYHHSGIGARTHNVIQGIERMPEYQIYNQDNMLFNRDITNIDYWDIDCKKPKNCAGTVILTVTNEDFQ